MKSNRTRPLCFGLTAILGLFIIVITVDSAKAQNTFPTPSGNVGIGTTSPGEPLTVQSTIGMRSSAGNTRMTINGSESENSVVTSGGTPLGLYISGTNYFKINTNSFDRFIITGNGNVGIGTTNPGELLSVNNGAVGTYFDRPNYGIRGIFQHGGNGSGILSAGGLQIATQGANHSSSGSGDINFFVTDSHSSGPFNDAGYKQAMKILYNGNVGIGTTSPGELLSVNHGALGAYYSKASYGIRGIFQHSGNGSGILNAGGLQIAAQGANNSSSGSGDINFFVTGSHSSGPFIDAGYAQVMKIRNDGNVGIGTTSPSYNLHVAGSFAWGTAGATRSYAGGATKLFAYADSNSNVHYSGGSGGFGINNAADSERLVQITDSGNVGIGIFNPGSYKLNVNGLINATGLNINGSPVTSSQWSAGSESINYTSGNVGIGTTSPSYNLHVAGSFAWGTAGATRSYAGGATKLFAYADSNSNVHYSGGSGGFGINNAADSERLVQITDSGNVGIGEFSPSEKLQVNGNLKLTGTGSINAAGTIEAGNIKAKYQDLAEWVPASEQLSPGTVVVLDSTKSNQVTSSSVSYDTRVAGVISEQPGIALGEQGEGKVLVATTGRVRVKVDASKGPIHIGDLLVTSDVPGMAMKSEPIEMAGRKMHMPGTLIGKALEPLAKGSGEILVLLSLQ